MATNQFQGLLGTFGLPTNSPHEELARRAGMLHKQTTDRIAPNDTSLASMGARIGSGLGAKMLTRELPPEEQKKYALVSAVNERIESFKRSKPEEWEAMPIEERGMMFQKTLAENALNMGMPDIGMPAAMQYAQQKKAREKQDMELRKLGNQAEASDVLPDQTRANLEQTRTSTAINRQTGEKNELALERARRGELMTVWPTGSTSPEEGVSVYLDMEGNARPITQPDQVMTPGNYSIVPPKEPRSSGRGGSGRDIELTPSEAGSIRQRQRDVIATMRGGMLLKEALEQSIDSDGNINIMGGAGGAKSFVVRLADNIRSLGRSFNITMSGGVEGASGLITDQRSAERFLSKNKEYDNFVDDIIKDSNPELRRGTVAHARYKAGLTHLAYMFARANEPSGARQLSDLDFKNAIEMIGANATDPEVLRQVMVDRVNAATGDFELTLQQLGPNGAQAVMSPSAINEYFTRKEEFEKAFGLDFGRAASPGPGLESGQLTEEEREDLTSDIDIPPYIGKQNGN